MVQYIHFKTGDGREYVVAMKGSRQLTVISQHFGAESDYANLHRENYSWPCSLVTLGYICTVSLAGFLPRNKTEVPRILEEYLREYVEVHSE